MTPNQVTAIRVAMAFAAVAVFWGSDASGTLTYWAGAAGLALIVAAIALDGVDGWLARRRNLATPLGGQIDILGDRIVENLFFTFFAVTGLVSLWVPVVFFARGMLTDFLRSVAERAQRSTRDPAAFRRNWMLESAWGRALVASRASRAAYGALKCICFCALAAELTLARGSIERLVDLPWRFAAAVCTQALVALTVGFCLLRALPVAWEARATLASLAASSPSRPRTERATVSGARP
jgi:CDP-diacylglycerol---glycerol-3-phosphate 3-phosphatidyltransferase